MEPTRATRSITDRIKNYISMQKHVSIINVFLSRGYFKKKKHKNNTLKILVSLEACFLCNPVIIKK
jgi:hypothetical protein